VAAEAGIARWHAVAARQLWLRFAVGTLSLLLGGLGFWWAWSTANA
jgi:hypothetical protein